MSEIEICFIFVSTNGKGMFSKACEYAIRATLHIAQESLKGRRVGLKEIAKAIDSPVAFTAKILQILSRNNIVQSLKGPTGGFEIQPERISETKLSQIVFAIDGDKIYQGCGLGLNKCDAEKPCPVHFQFVAIRDGMQKMLEETSVLELAEGLEEGLTFLKR